MRFNVKLLAGTVATVIALVTGVYFIHAFQVRRTAGSLKELAARERADGRLEQAAGFLRRYVGLVPNDADALADYADLRDKLAKTGRDHYGVLELYEKILRQNPDRLDIRRLAIKKAMFLHRWTDARQHIEAAAGSGKKMDGELYYWKGLCQKAVQEKGAEDSFQKAYDADKTLIDSYLQRAFLLRADLDQLLDTDAREKQAKEIDATLDSMVANNRQSPKAYVCLLQYLSIPPADRTAREEWKRTRAAAVQAAQDLQEGHDGRDNAELLLAFANWAAEDKPEERRAYLRRGVANYPKDLRFCDAMSRLEWEAGNKDLAKEILEHYLDPKNQPGAAETAHAHYLLGEILIENGDLHGARGEVSQLRGSPSLASLLDAHILLVAGKWRKSAQLLEQIRVQLGAAPDLARKADLLLAICYEHMEEPDLQLAVSQRLVSSDPTHANGRAALAAAFAANGRTAEALAEFRRLADPKQELRLNPDQHFELEINMARLLASQMLRLAKAERTKPRWDEIEEHIKKAEAALPNSPRIPLLRAEVLAAQGRFDEARTNLERARDENPKQVELWIGLADLAQQQGKAEQALQILEDGRSKFPERVELRLALVHHWTENGTPKEPLEELEKGMDGFSSAERARLFAELAEAQRRAGRKQEAERLWSEVTKLQDDDLHSRLALLELALENRDEDKAKHLVEDIKRIDGEDGFWWRFERAAAILLLAKGKDSGGWAEAETLLGEAAERRPTWSRVPRLQAELAIQQGNPERAIEHLQRGLALGERDPRTIGRLLTLLFERGRFPDADIVLRRAAENSAVLTADLNKLGTQIAVLNRDQDLARKLALQAVPDDDKDYRNHLWLAFVLAGLDHPKAPESLQKAKALNPDAPEVWAAAVAFYRNAKGKAKDPKTAEKMEAALQEAFKEAQEKLTALHAPLALAECNDMLGRTEAAETLFDAALRAKPDDVATLRSVASHYQTHLQPQKAEPLLRKMLKPDNRAPEADAVWARRSLALVIAPRGDGLQVQEALDLVEKNLQAKPDSLEDVRAKSMILATQTNQLQEAIDLYEKLDRTTPLASDDLFTLARLHDAAKDWPKARQRMNSLIAAAPDNLAYLAAFANGLIRHDELEDARGVLIKIKSLRPKALAALELEVRLLEAQEKRGEPEKLSEAVELIRSRADEKDAPLQGLATLMESLGKTEEAEKLFLRLAKEAKKPEDVLQLALFDGRTGRPADGLRICEQARETCPREQVALVSAMVVRASSATEEQRDSVERWLKPIVEQTPTPHFLSIWAELQDLRGRYAEAEKAWRTVIEKDQNHVIALNNLACQLAFTHAKGEEALQLINHAMLLASPIPDLLDTRGLVYLSRGDTARAIGDLELAVQRSPTASKYYHLARAYQSASRSDASRDTWRKAVEAKLKVEDLHPLEAAEFKEFAAKMNAK